MVGPLEHYQSSGIHSPDLGDFMLRVQNAVRQQFSGNLCFQMQPEQVWKLTFRHGRLVWATAGIHRVRRWCCLTHQYLGSAQLPNGAAAAHPHWEYQALLHLAQAGTSREKLQQMVHQATVEVLFELVQLLSTSWQTQTQVSEVAFKVTEPLCFFAVNDLLNEANQQWQSWSAAQLQLYRPTLAPVINSAERLKRKLPEGPYQQLTRMLQDLRSLRELAILTRQDLAGLTQTLVGYERPGLIRFDEIPDLAIPQMVVTPDSSQV
jgi:two-component system, chemotaxis family, response regulator PixG